MRVMVKRLLKKYHYPPEGQEQALRTVMEQCDKWADDEENLEPTNVVKLYPQLEEGSSLLMAAEEEESFN